LLKLPHETETLVSPKDLDDLVDEDLCLAKLVFFFVGEGRVVFQGLTDEIVLLANFCIGVLQR
jgi:hypothetical protein